MGQKDIAEKTLEAYNDVFADIVNVLLFNGEELVCESDLEDAPSESALKIDDNLHSQQRDVAKYWKNCNIRIALFGFENQTEIDLDMPLRIMGYDGALYKKQTLKKKNDNKKDNHGKERFPVVTLVLYFGLRRWKKPRNLLESINVPEVLKPYVSDYNINIFEIAYLTDKQLSLFKSDFKIVADYFVQKRKNKKYVPSKQVIEHVEEILQMMRILTGDKKFDYIDEKCVKKGEKITMDTWLSDTIGKAEKKAEKKGRLEAFAQMVNEGILSLQQAAAKMGMSVAKFKKAVAELATNS